jgi:hypothetical protein
MQARTNNPIRATTPITLPAMMPGLLPLLFPPESGGDGVTVEDSDDEDDEDTKLDVCAVDDETAGPKNESPLLEVDVTAVGNISLGVPVVSAKSTTGCAMSVIKLAGCITRSLDHYSSP